MIRLQDYWMGRDAKYPDDLTPAIRENAAETVRRANLLLERAAEDWVFAGVDQRTGTAVASGWRPPAVNDRTANAGKKSRHMTGEGIDIQDTESRVLARWCLRNLEVLEDIGLWMEDPRWTGGKDPWVHLQIVPPGSKKLVYIPSEAPPIAEALIEQGGKA